MFFLKKGTKLSQPWGQFARLHASVSKAQIARPFQANVTLVLRYNVRGYTIRQIGCHVLYFTIWIGVILFLCKGTAEVAEHWCNLNVTPHIYTLKKMFCSGLNSSYIQQCLNKTIAIILYIVYTYDSID